MQLSAPSEQPTPALDLIRCRTRNLHVAVESKLPLLRPDVSESDYRRYVAMMLGFHRPLEHRVRLAIADQERASLEPQRWKTPLLTDDLAALSGPAAAEQVRDCLELPALGGPGAVLGCLYVLEGATLGGQVLLRHLSRSLPGPLAAASRYLRCYGEETGRNWRAFTARLEAHDDGAGTTGEMVTAAAATFAALLTWMDEWETV